MRTSPIWRGVRMRTLHAGADPDSPTRMVTLPAAWDVAAAEALSVLAPGRRSVSLAEAAEAWVRPLARRAAQLGEAPELHARLHALLLHRRAAPNAAVWAAAPCNPAPSDPAVDEDLRVHAPGFVLSLPAFHGAAFHGAAAVTGTRAQGRAAARGEPDARGEAAEGADPEGFDVAGFVAAVDTVAEALRMIDGVEAWVGLSGLDALLAALGLDYASRAARDVAACLAALLRARVDAVMSDGQRDLLRHEPSWPAAPACCVVPGLAEAAAAARDAAGGLPELDAAAVAAPGPADALLGLETAGIAPAFASVTPEGSLTQATQARLAAQALSPEAALALVLRGDTLLSPADAAAHAAMHDAVAPFLPRMPQRPRVAVPAALPGTRRRTMPARHSGSMQKATLGGHRLFLRTGEFADGTVGEIEVTLPRESALARGLTEGLAQAVNLGLQYGVPLVAFVEAFAGTQFGPAGAVEGDPAVSFATSPLDYVARTLAAHYLGEALPAVDVEPAPQPSGEPELPLELPRRPRLRLVA